MPLMRAQSLLALALIGLLAACSSMRKKPETGPLHSLKDAQKRAVSHHAVIAVPAFETTPEAVQALVKQTIATGNAQLDEIGRLDPRKTSFDDTARALDDLDHLANTAAHRLEFLKETSPNAALRDAATEGEKALQEWGVGIEYREDVYRAVKAYADTQPKLFGEDAKLLEETLRDYRRAGLALPKAERDDVERLRKELTRLTTDFDRNVNKAQKPMKVVAAAMKTVSRIKLKQG